MSIQDPIALALQALSSVKDTPLDSQQPALEDGVHLRWFFGENRDFPLKGGYFLFRRRVGAPPNCLMPLLQGRTPADVAKLSLVPTSIGTLKVVPAGDTGGQNLAPLPIASTSDGISDSPLTSRGCNSLYQLLRRRSAPLSSRCGCSFLFRRLFLGVRSPRPRRQCHTFRLQPCMDSQRS
jgi:hypothetical protein